MASGPRNENEGRAATERSGRNEDLALALRATASYAAECGEGFALVFATTPGDSAPGDGPRLRAAAGFASAPAARDVAARLEPQLLEILASAHERPEARCLDPEGSPTERAPGGVLIHPLVFEKRVYGALAVGLGGPLDDRSAGAIAGMAGSTSLRLDHARLAEQIAEHQRSREESALDEKNDEILKLSEALFAQDIELLRNNEKLGKIEKLKNDFIEKMSRELRTPLNSIIESIISVLTGENDALSAGAKASLRSALDDGTSFLRTLQNILDLWRIKQSELPIEIQEMNFREVVDETIFSVQDSIGDKPLVIEPKLDAGLPKIRADLAKVNQILFLLLDNAVKFSPQGRIEIAARLDREQLVCEVRDTGIGICPDDQPYVFDEFFQVDEPSSTKYHGAGLGLTLVRDLIVLLEGEISLSSEIGAGTAITFQIPVQRAG